MFAMHTKGLSLKTVNSVHFLAPVAELSMANFLYSQGDPKLINSLAWLAKQDWTRTVANSLVFTLISSQQ